MAVTLYTVPITLAGRILGMTGRLSSVIFSMPAHPAATARIDELRPTHLGAIRHITYLNFVFCAGMVLAGDEFLRRWVGDAFPTQGYPVLVLMAFALLADSPDQHSFSGQRCTRAPPYLRCICPGAWAHRSGVHLFRHEHLRHRWRSSGPPIHRLAVGCCLFIYVHGRTVPIGLIETVRHGGLPLLAGMSILALLLAGKWLLPGRNNGNWSDDHRRHVASAVGICYVVRNDERAALLITLRQKTREIAQDAYPDR